MFLRNYTRRVREKGVTLIEVAMALAVMALVTAAIMYAYQSANTSRQTETAMKDLASLQNAVRSLYGSMPTYNGLTEENLIDANMVPRRMVNAAGNGLIHTFNGVIAIQPENVDGQTDAGFSIEYANVPREACMRLIVLDLGTGLSEVDTGLGASPFAETDFPITPTQANTACDATSVTITWTFR